MTATATSTAQVPMTPKKMPIDQEKDIDAVILTHTHRDHSALATDLVHHDRERGEIIIGRLLGLVGDEAV